MFISNTIVNKYLRLYLYRLIQTLYFEQMTYGLINIYTITLRKSILFLQWGRIYTSLNIIIRYVHEIMLFR